DPECVAGRESERVLVLVDAVAAVPDLREVGAVVRVAVQVDAARVEGRRVTRVDADGERVEALVPVGAAEAGVEGEARPVRAVGRREDAVELARVAGRR